MTPETPPAGSAPGFPAMLMDWKFFESVGELIDLLPYELPDYAGQQAVDVAFRWAKIANARDAAILSETPAPDPLSILARLIAWYDTHCDPAVPPDEHAACELRALVDEARKITAEVEGA